MGNSLSVLKTHIILMYISAQECLQPADSRGRPIPFENTKGLTDSLPNNLQAIITSYQFQCCGNITAWQLYVSSRRTCHKCMNIIHFQIWRPTPSVTTDGCYSLVGEDRYANASLHERQRVTLEHANFITIQPGDVVGFYTQRERLLLDRDYVDETIWFSTEVGSNPPRVGEICPHPVGRDRELSRPSNAAVLLSVAVSKYI